jgi:hypothetical protein
MDAGQGTQHRTGISAALLRDLPAHAAGPGRPSTAVDTLPNGGTGGRGSHEQTSYRNHAGHLRTRFFEYMFDILEVRKRGAPPPGPRVTGLEDPPARKVQDRFTSTAPGASCINCPDARLPMAANSPLTGLRTHPCGPEAPPNQSGQFNLKMQLRLRGAEEVAAAITTIENIMTAAPERRRGRRQRQIKNPIRVLTTANGPHPHSDTVPSRPGWRRG